MAGVNRPSQLSAGPGRCGACSLESFRFALEYARLQKEPKTNPHSARYYAYVDDRAHLLSHVER
jgi:hypothetical protein